MYLHEFDLTNATLHGLLVLSQSRSRGFRKHVQLDRQPVPFISQKSRPRVSVKLIRNSALYLLRGRDSLRRRVLIFHRENVQTDDEGLGEVPDGLLDVGSFHLLGARLSVELPEVLPRWRSEPEASRG